MLNIKKINVYYDEIQILKNVSINVNGKEIISVVGANGAGKTTLLNTISGFLKPSSGDIDFLGEGISNLPPHLVVEKGIIQIPEGRKLFPSLSVRENLELGAYVKRAKQKRGRALEIVFDLFPPLKERQKQLAGTLSGGEQQMLAIGRGLMSDPRLLMLDEPSLGLAPILVEELFRIILNIFKMGTTILLVEQNVGQSLTLSLRGYILENGKIVLEGKSEDLLKNEHLRRAYLGL